MLTDEMTRLCGEIVALRTHRGEMMESLQRDSSERREMVSNLCKQFHSAHLERMNKTRAELHSFLRRLRQEVNTQRKAMRSDLAGARRVWAGSAS